MSHLSELSASPHTSTLTAYRGLAPDEQLDAVYEASVGLRGLRVVHINTTIKGGGVAGMISQLCPIANELGLPHERLIVELDSKSARFFASMTDMLQGGGPGFPPLELKKHFWITCLVRRKLLLFQRQTFMSFMILRLHLWRKC